MGPGMSILHLSQHTLCGRAAWETTTFGVALPVWQSTGVHNTCWPIFLPTGHSPPSWWPRELLPQSWTAWEGTHTQLFQGWFSTTDSTVLWLFHQMCSLP